MSTINLHNYESFLLDYSEGSLNAEVVSELKAFVLAHPELEIDLDDFSLPYLQEENNAVDFKNTLRKTENEVPDQELLNYLEGHLSLEQRLAFESKLSQDKDLAKDLGLYRKTILAADLNLVSEFKAELHKTEDDLPLNNRVIAYLENQLAFSEKIEFEKELFVNTDLQKEFATLSKTILPIDKDLVYPDKEALKKENKLIPLFNIRTVGSVAAAIILLFGFAIVFNYNSSVAGDQSRIAKNRSQSQETKIAANTAATSPTKTLSIEKDALTFPDKNVVPEKTAPMLAKREKIKSSPKEEVHSGGLEKNDLPLEKQDTEKNIAKEEIQKPILPEAQKQESSQDVVALAKEDSVNNRSYFLPVEEIEENEDDLVQKGGNKRGLWKRAVQLAKQANKLGVKSIDGQENSQNTYRLSFNSFSVEKK